MRHRTCLLAALVCVVVPVSALRAHDTILLAGGEFSEADFYSYVGLVMPVPGSTGASGWFQRYWIDRFGYEYQSGTARIEARVWGGEAALGYGVPTTHGWRSISLGLRYTDTGLAPDDQDASARGKQTSAKVQFEGETEFQPGWRIGAIASYTILQEQYWGRVRLTRRVDSNWSVGAEAIANGNEEAQSLAGGLVLTFQPNGGRWTVGVKAGYREQDESDGYYTGLELYRPF